MGDSIPGQRRICVMVTSGDTAHFLEGYLAALAGDGWSVTLICSPTHWIHEFAQNEGVNLRVVKLERDPAPVRDFIGLVRLIRVLRQIRPDAVVYATPKASLLGSIAATTLRVKVRIYEVWGLRLETTSGLTRKILHACERTTCALSTAVVANSFSLAEKMQELRVAGSRHIEVLGAGSSHGVDLEKFSAAASVSEPDAETSEFLRQTPGFTVGFIGRLHRDKGIDCLLNALVLCAEAGIRVRGLIVGGDDGAEISYLIEQSRAKVPIHRVDEVADIRPYLRAMGVLVLMSLREGFPNVVLEAASMGVPAIVADSTGTVDSVVDGMTGFVVPVNNSAMLASRISELAADTELGMRLGDAARDRVAAEFAQRAVWDLHHKYFANQYETAVGPIGEP